MATTAAEHLISASRLGPAGCICDGSKLGRLWQLPACSKKYEVTMLGRHPHCSVRRPLKALDSPCSSRGVSGLGCKSKWGSSAAVCCLAMWDAHARPWPAVFSAPGRSGLFRRNKSRPQLVVFVGAPSTDREAESQAGDDLPAGNGGSQEYGGGDGQGGGGDGSGGAMGYASNGILFFLWAGLIAYAVALAPSQTPFRDQYFLEKLVFLRADDGFYMNPVLVNVWYIMGIWPVIYTALLIPGGRSSKGGPPVWPFAALSTFFGAGALLPYFALWKPPVPRVSQEELNKLPLKVLESKIFAAVVTLAVVALLVTGGLAPADSWREYIQYFRESKFIHVMSIDFLTLSVLAPFWVYNDLAVRRGLEKKFWLVPLAVLPVLGPALHLVFRPSLPSEVIEEDGIEL